MDIVLCSWMLLIHSIYNSLHLPVNQGKAFFDDDGPLTSTKTYNVDET